MLTHGSVEFNWSPVRDGFGVLDSIFGAGGVAKPRRSRRSSVGRAADS